jgi:eukaryotic-like serine/threonine-protein kinase
MKIRVLDVFKQPLNLKTRLHLLEQVSNGLVHLHRLQLIHRDLHYGNVLVYPQRVGLFTSHQADIIDLGLVAAWPGRDNKITEENDELGRIAPAQIDFIAPEMIDLDGFHHASDKSDIYSLGTMLVGLMAGHLPFPTLANGDSTDGLSDNVTAQAIYYAKLHQAPDLEGVPAPCVDLATRMLSRDPAERPNAVRVRAEIKSILTKNYR